MSFDDTVHTTRRPFGMFFSFAICAIIAFIFLRIKFLFTAVGIVFAGTRITTPHGFFGTTSRAKEIKDSFLRLPS